MPQTNQNHLKSITDFFRTRPELEFFVGEVEPDVVRAASAAGWIYALASQPSTATPEVRFLSVHEGQDAIPVVVRRADPAGGYPAPCMIVMDDGFPLPPFQAAPEGAIRDRASESFGGFVWQLAVETRRTGRTINDAFTDAMLSR